MTTSPLRRDRLAPLLCCFSFIGSIFGQAKGPGVVLDCATLTDGYGAGHDDSAHIAQTVPWMTTISDPDCNYFRLAYPPNLQWGAMFITVGPPVNPPHPFMDFSSYSFLQVEMKGEKGGEDVLIGVKTNLDPDDGTESR